MRRTMPLRFEGDDDDADPKEVSSILLLLTVKAPADEIMASEGEGSRRRRRFWSGADKLVADEC